MARKMKTMDGNTAAAHAAYAFTDVAGIYPITPSSPMADYVDKWSAAGTTNIFGQQVKVSEMQSEAGAAGVVHGSLAAGALTTTFTASQGLLLMIPNMYKIAGELLPGVFHVSARALASHALSIFGDHSDVMACRQTGFAMLASTNPQEAMDLGAIAHLAAIKGRVPFLHFFDGFRTSHEMQNIEIWDYKDLAEMVDMDAVKAFRARALNPEHPVLRGTAQNPDIFFQAREACNPYYNALPEIVEEYMAKVNAKIGTNYQLFNYYGAEDAETVIIAMGSVNDAAEEVIDYLTAKGEKVGLVKVRLYRPFRADKLLAAIPATVKTIAVLDRTKEPGALGEPLFLDVQAAVAASDRKINVIGGRYGLGSKDVTPGCLVSVIRNAQSAEPKNGFTVGIEDDVTFLSLPIDENPDVTPAGIVSCKFWGLGSDGTVGANKNSIKIIGGVKKYAQAYFEYDSKKSGGLTISHLRFGDVPIKSTYYVTKADFVACHNPAYMGQYEIAQDVKPGGSFLLNTHWTDEELSEHLPAAAKRHIAQNNIKFYTVDGFKAGREIGLGTRINTVLQSAFFKITGIVPLDKAIEDMKKFIQISYGRKGEEIVNMNYAAVDAGVNMVHEVTIPADWATAEDACTACSDCSSCSGCAGSGRPELDKFVKEILQPVNKHLGDRLPVSTFADMADGTFPQGSAAFEKRGVAVDVPEWDPEKCIQCNQCSLICPHAVVRPYLLNADEAANAPAGTKMADMKPKGEYKFAMGVSVLDCVGCGLCAKVCPAKEKALVMKPLESQASQQASYDYLAATVTEKETNFKPETVKGSQFKQPLLEFSGACPGCGETAYAKLITQL
ncbi:MAG: pyruvate:ferredoxin (flavodoxin) oxidoreductase, partial [Ruminococcaceae bacterium]|nr:pyruvate:ferredoxin (flavodoxin) oxidoreductase [Oscillospiraceae bacterium]